MPHNRYYTDTAFKENTKIELTGDEAHHLIRVLRAQKGDTVELVNGHGILALAQIIEIKPCLLQVLQIKTQKPPPSIILAQGLPRMNHLDWIIEKAVELGVSDFWLFPGQLSEKKTVSTSQMNRLKSLSISAMKQCGRLDLPPIHLLPPITQWKPSPTGTFILADTDPRASYLWKLSWKKPLPLIICIGPEKGFSQEERHFLLEKLQATQVRLHSNTLRTETAGIAALSLIQAFL